MNHKLLPCLFLFFFFYIKNVDVDIENHFASEMFSQNKNFDKGTLCDKLDDYL